MEKFNISDKVIVKEGYSNLIGEVGIIVGIDLEEEIDTGKYLVKFNSLDMRSGCNYKMFCDYPDIVIEPYEGYAEWIDEEDLIKVKEGSEEDIKNKFNKIREQKKEAIKKMNEKILQLTLEIKELEAEIEKIKKEYYL